MKGLQLKGASIYVVRGSPKSRRKEENQLICDSAKGGGDGVKKSEIFADIIYGSPLMLNVIAERDVQVVPIYLVVMTTYNSPLP